jgi:hypothetical protein
MAFINYAVVDNRLHGVAHRLGNDHLNSQIDAVLIRTEKREYFAFAIPPLAPAALGW